MQQQRLLYDGLIRCNWDTVKTFTQNDPQLKRDAGATAAIDSDQRLRRTKKGYNKTKLFNLKALAKVFCTELLEAMGRRLDAAGPLRPTGKWEVQKP